MHESHNDLVCSFSPKMPCTAKLPQGLHPAAPERGHSLPPLLWQHSSPPPSSELPAMANIAGTVEWDEKPGAAAPHAQIHACTVFTQSGSQGPHKNGAVVI